MAIPSEFTTTVCSHCQRDIPTLNIDLHFAHCSRNLEKCTICGEMVPKRHADEHYLNIHAPVACSQCSETIERDALDLHKDESCPQRMVTCEYCEFPLPAVDLFQHQELCGNRTEMCVQCSKYVRRCERIQHDIQLHSSTESIAESSRIPTDAMVPERRDIPRRQAHGSSKRRILFTIAVTGIAVLLGSIFLQRRADHSQHQ
ncbi:uncharacterized protein [Aristolochia californica]|uniref:uncharacterized protein isoform X1 n=1 Tax=Aristolochia californica TaxID=171875 RepID=UPI0035D9293D